MSIERYEKEAAAVKNAILELAEKPDALENLESYLSIHFAEWLSKWANDPESFAFELHQFATMFDK